MEIKSIKPTGTLIESELELALWAQRVSIGIDRYLGKALTAYQKAFIAELVDAGEISALNKRQFDALIRLIDELGHEYLSGEVQRALDDIAQLSEITVAAEALTIARLSKKAIKKIAQPFKLAVQTPIAATGDLLEPFVDGLTQTAITKMERELRISLANNRTLGETTAALKKVAADMSKRDIEAVISTATQHTFNVCRDAVYEANDIDKVKCVATLDVRVCMYCAALDGKVVARKDAPKYPLHPRCRCLTVPEIEGMEAFREGATRSSEDGYVPQSMTAFDYLRKKPMSELIDAYGPTVAKAIKGEGMTNTKFRSLALDKALQPISIGDMKKKMEERGLL